MPTYVYIILAILLGVVLIFRIGSHPFRKKHANFTQQEVIVTLEAILSQKNLSHDYNLEMFCQYHIKDPYLNSIRKRVIAIRAQYPGLIELSPDGYAEIENCWKKCGRINNATFHQITICKLLPM